jgi:hypothetical protein
MAEKKKPTEAQKARKNQQRVATRRRNQYERENPERFASLGEQHEQHLLNSGEFKEQMQRVGRDPVAEAARSRSATDKMGSQQFYHLMGYSRIDSEATEASNNPFQETLFDHPGTVPNPPLWEDMSKDAQQRTLDALSAKGVTMESASKAVGSRIDKAFLSEEGQHGNFYAVEGESVTGAKMPRQVLKDSTTARGIPFSLTAATNAQASPRSRFVQKSAEGHMTYPNNHSAMYSVDWAMHGREAADAAFKAERAGASPDEVRDVIQRNSGRGMTGDEYLHHPDFYVPKEDKVKTRGGNLVKAKDETRAYPVQGYPANNKKAIDTTRAVMGIGQEKASLSDVWSHGGQKVSPFHNAWVAPHEPEGNFSVLDTHAADVIAPHLSAADQTTLVEIGGAKSFNDYVMRQEIGKRGLTSVNRAQSATWRSTKEDEGHASDVAELTPARRHGIGQQFEQIRGQQKMEFPGWEPQ